MKNTYQILPVYSGDVSGACAALYELGGMVVMHDPSGCNSTYNTFDEVRWYEKESLIFLSGMTDVDAITGNDKKLIADILMAAGELHPRFIALVNSPIPFLNGTDFAGICRILEDRLNIPAFYVSTNGAHDYTEGAGQAFLQAARRLVDGNGEKRPGTVNILGMTPLNYTLSGSGKRMEAILTEAGFPVNANWALDCDPETFSRASAAPVNLVVSSAGLYAAEELHRRFGIPYVIGAPLGGFAPAVMEALKTAMETGENQVPHIQSRKGGEPDVTLVGEPVVMTSLAASIELETGKTTEVLCPTEVTRGLLGSADQSVAGEAEMQEALRSARHIVADPLYRSVSPEGVPFTPLPDLAFSGRLYLKQTPDLFTWKLS